MTSSSRGIFICIEGIDAVGKRTQTSLLSSWLAGRGIQNRTTSFPNYGTTIGREIKKFLLGSVSYPPEVRALLYAANRWEKKAEIEAALESSEALIVNRYTGSNLAYGMSNGLPLAWLLGLEEGLPKPDLTILLDAPANHLIPRRSQNKDTYERNLSLQEQARKAYLSLSKEFDWEVVDATQGIRLTGEVVAHMVSTILPERESRA